MAAIIDMEIVKSCHFSFYFEPNVIAVEHKDNSWSTPCLNWYKGGISVEVLIKQRPTSCLNAHVLYLPIIMINDLFSIEGEST